MTQRESAANQRRAKSSEERYHKTTITRQGTIASNTKADEPSNTKADEPSNTKADESSNTTDRTFTRRRSRQGGYDIEELKLRLEKLEELRKALLDSLIELAVHDPELSEAETDQEIEQYEEKYINLKLIGERILKERIRPALAENNLDQALAGINLMANNNTRSRANETHIRLPKIDLPTFSGAYEEWHSFFGIFDSLIHSNNSLNDIQKFHYLKSALKGEAAEIIKALEITEANYNDAWLRLKEIYDNERMAVQNHIKSILDLPSLRKENSVALRNLLDNTLKHTRALTALKRPVQHWDDLLIYIIASKLDYFTIKEWENSVESKHLPTFNEFVEFLTRRCETLEAIARRSMSIELNGKTNRTFNKVTTAHAAVTSVKCPNCKNDHPIYHCKDFKDLSVTQRINRVKMLKLCLNCLKGKHIAKDCTASSCRKCAKKHSSLLHDEHYSTSEDKVETIKSNAKQENEGNKEDRTVCTHARSSQIANSMQELLSTAVVLVKDHKGRYIEGKALLDCGSQSNFATANFVKKLNVKTTDSHVKIKGINRQVSRSLKTVNLHVASRFGTFGVDMSCIVLPEIIGDLPTVEFDTDSLNIPKNIKLADPRFNVSSRIDLLIGIDRFWKLICIGQIKLGKGQPILQKTLLGWMSQGQ
ncbi:uncharacterized protein LOC113004977 [Solenopsis invicta]|uniref:uncharacterized protein LOC113004977 n=1 Tax=Solenopsis invicta TaxID=13686 RepID=UPI00193E1D76|nr:uncharacterized protein LOC113004977 [Solenopsis invicta]